MKKTEKEFVIDKRRPQVLFLGNGLCRAYGGISWNGLLDELKEKDQYPVDAKSYLMPLPLKAAMLTNNSLAKKMRNIVMPHDKQDPKVDRYDWTSFIKVTPEMKVQLIRLIHDQFDYVLTTNYSYEIEAAILDQKNLSVSQISDSMNFYEINNAQRKFLLNTYNEVGGIPIWHVHGEARKPDSMIIGNYYYGKLLRRCVERLDGSNSLSNENSNKKSTQKSKTNYFKSCIQQNKPIKIGSWVDAFVLGDVYILGFGLDFSETDIWWLLEYKANHGDICGNTYFYEPKKETDNRCVNDENIICKQRTQFVDGNQCRNFLLKNTYRIAVRDLGITAICNEDYVRFYTHAVEDILHSLNKE